MSKKELAERTGFDPSYVSHIENGRHQPTEEFARRVERCWTAATGSGSGTSSSPTPGSGGRPSPLGPTAVPPPTGPHLVIEDEQATLSLVDGVYECRFRRVLHSVGTEPITRHTVQIDIDRFPDDPARSTAFHSHHPLTIDEVGFRATIGAEQAEPMRWRVSRSRDAFLKIVLLLDSGGAPMPLYPGQRTVVDYAYRVPAWKFGDWLQRDIRLPTRNLVIRLDFPAETGPTVWGGRPRSPRRPPSRCTRTAGNGRGGSRTSGWCPGPGCAPSTGSTGATPTRAPRWSTPRRTSDRWPAERRRRTGPTARVTQRRPVRKFRPDWPTGVVSDRSGPLFGLGIAVRRARPLGSKAERGRQNHRSRSMQMASNGW